MKFGMRIGVVEVNAYFLRIFLKIISTEIIII